MVFKFNPDKLRKDFPILKSKLAYFDNACMALKPKQVIDKINEYYLEYPSCHGRSPHRLSARLNKEMDKTREIVRKFIGAKKVEEIIFTRNTTESINLIANSFNLNKGDVVIISSKEHNSNLVPWLKLVKEKGIKLEIVKSTVDNLFDIDSFIDLLAKYKKKIKLVSLVHTSNLDGVTLPVIEIIKMAHIAGSKVLLDGAQTIPHKEVNVSKLDVDFYAFSGHKMMGPSGIGVLYGKKKLLEELDQFLVGGETVQDSTYSSYVKEDLPMRFEAGLQHYAGIVGLGAACQYLSKIGLKKIADHETELNKIIQEGLSDDIDSGKIKLIGPENPKLRGGIFNFVIPKMDPHEVAIMLDSHGFAVRSGAHCCHSWFNNHKLEGSVRASLYAYNTEEEAKKFVKVVKKVLELVK